jgi:hypothetical protein
VTVAKENMEKKMVKGLSDDTGTMAQMVDHLPSKHEALTSNIVLQGKKPVQEGSICG